MASDRPHANCPLPNQPNAPPLRTKFRIRFRKGGDLRLVSHHDLMKCVERMLRRASLAVTRTQGFHPKPRMVFALSLALGIVGCQEVLELQFDEPPTPEALHEALSRQAPPGLEILSVQSIDVKQSAQPRRVCYRLALPAERSHEVPERIRRVLEAPEAWVLRRRPPARRIDVRPYVRDLRLVDGSLEIDLWVTPQGTARPEEVLALLELEDLRDAGAILERTTLELHDETHEPGSPTIQETVRRSPPERAERTARPTALVSGPLTFDT